LDVFLRIAACIALYFDFLCSDGAMNKSSYNFAFDQIEIIDRADTPTDLSAALLNAAKQFGFNACVISAFPDPDIPFSKSVLTQEFPAGWFEHYLKQEYSTVDPVFRRARDLFRPFSWSRELLMPGLDEKAALLMNEAAEFKLACGFCVPSYSTVGPALVGFAGDRNELTRDDRGALSLVSVYAQIRATELLARKPILASQSGLLSPRERETLRWCSEDKTTREIADILGISPNTVITHISSACRKLEVSSRTAAVAKAIRARII
jgi:LuxR family quorum sensing-dependent transcriptional regulator